ncbi:MAG: hypothetical protein ACOC0U_07055 [Desulfovibrionales bacterium]
MFVFFHLLLALAVAVGFSVFLVLAFGKDKAWEGFLVFFVIIFLMTWAGGLWVRPFGPAMGEVYWLPFIASGLLVALILGAIHYARTTRSQSITEEEKGKKVHHAEQAVEIGTWFWVLIIILLAAIFIGYIVP